ncbi:MAG TPA: capsid cement protein [Allosphingosinicella sp.]|nr:capsid cement protein [Allosphingosinicella sp.]
MQKTPILTLTSPVATAAVAQYRFVDFDGTQCDAAGAKPMGVSVHPAAIGEVFAVDVLGTTKVEAGAAIALGAKGLTPVKTDANGKAIAQGGVGEIAGYALQAAGADGAIIEILLTP